jgi:hypothetical protein
VVAFGIRFFPVAVAAAAEAVLVPAAGGAAPPTCCASAVKLPAPQAARTPSESVRLTECLTE